MTVFKRTCFKVLLLISALSAVAKSEDGPSAMFEEALKSFGDAGKLALETALGGPAVLGSLKEVLECIAKEADPKKLDFCNFKFSFDPFLYIQKCANGTLFGEFLINAVKNIPHTNLPFGIPNKVSKDRCFNLTTPLGALVSTPASKPKLGLK